MSGYDPNGMSSAVLPTYDEAGAVVAAPDGALDDPRNYQAVDAYGGKGGKGEGMSQTEKLWLFGEKKPLSVQSYGSLPVEVRRVAAQHTPSERGYRRSR
jgi:hypothetical protein